MGHVLISLVLLGLIDDAATQAMRREAEAAAKQKRDAFARLEKLPAPAPVWRRPVADLNAVLWKEVEPGDERVFPPRRPKVLVLEETFDQAVFGSTGDAESGRAYLEKMLDRKIKEVEQVRRLLPAQKKRLSLAGRGDIKRLFDRIEEERKEFQLVRDNLERCAEFLDGLRPIQIALRQGPFEFGSLYAKTLKKMLDEGELARRMSRPSGS
jgi:hypothetical protein